MLCLGFFNDQVVIVLPHDNRTGSCAIVVGLSSARYRERPQGAPSSVVHWSLKYEGELHNRVARLIRLPFYEFCCELEVTIWRKLASLFT